MDVKSMIKRGLRFIVKGVPVNVVNANICYLSPEKKLEGQKIIVTGGGRGLGFAMAKRFVAEGAQVLIAGRNEDTLKAASEKIDCEWLCLDMQNVNSFDQFIAQAAERLGGLDSLVSNAGISLHEENFAKVTPETFDAQINTNLRGPFFLTQKFVGYALENKQSANILFISSETGETVDERPYGWTKAATNSLVKGLAYRLAENDIRVNAIAPGVTASDMTGFSEDGNLYSKESKNGRIYLPGEIAEVATFLLSGVSGCISGQILTCNNGKTINARWK
jgi:3-oxoacyl-[acyl-carrier protein] reductase